jgi:hypothetical protein
VVEGRAEAWRVAHERAASGARVGLIVRGPLSSSQSHALVDLRVLADDPATFARALFATLHALDDAGVASVVVEAVPGDDLWWAVADRLKRAEA